MKKTGRPTEYDPKYCDELIAFFDVKHYEEGSDGHRVPNKLPTFEKFAVDIGVHRGTLIDWADRHTEFADAYKKAKDLQKVMLVQNGLLGLYQTAFAIFTAKNVTDMRDKADVDLTSGGKPISFKWEE